MRAYKKKSSLIFAFTLTLFFISCSEGHYISAIHHSSLSNEKKETEAKIISFENQENSEENRAKIEEETEKLTQINSKLVTNKKEQKKTIAIICGVEVEILDVLLNGDIDLDNDLNELKKKGELSLSQTQCVRRGIKATGGCNSGSCSGYKILKTIPGEHIRLVIKDLVSSKIIKTIELRNENNSMPNNKIIFRKLKNLRNNKHYNIDATVTKPDNSTLEYSINNVSFSAKGLTIN